MKSGILRRSIRRSIFVRVRATTFLQFLSRLTGLDRIINHPNRPRKLDEFNEIRKLGLQQNTLLFFLPSKIYLLLLIATTLLQKKKKVRTICLLSRRRRSFPGGTPTTDREANTDRDPASHLSYRFHPRVKIEKFE